MKYLFLLTFLCTFVNSSFTQFSKSFDINNSTEISIDFLYGDITIEQHDIQEIQIDGYFSVNDKDFLDEVTIDIEKQGNTMKLFLETDLSKAEKKLVVKNKKDENGDCQETFSGYLTDIDAAFTIKIPRNIKLKVHTTYGFVVIKNYWKDMNIHSVYGSIDAIFADLPANPKMALKSTYSSVDLTIPENLGAKIHMRTDYGKIYSDLNFQADFSQNSPAHGQELTTKINNGDGDISMIATYENIYLRKAK